MMRLNEREWKVFSLTGENGLFPIHATSTGVDSIKLKDGDDTTLPYITRTEMNNGISKFISAKNLAYGKDEGGCITIGLDTQTAYWQPTSFVTGQNIHVLRSGKLNFFSYQFIAVILRQQMKSKFNWGGNGATLGRLKKLKIMLPVTGEGKPDYKFMEDYIRELMDRKYKQYQDYVQKQMAALEEGRYVNQVVELLTTCKWSAFAISDIFEIKPGKRLVASETTEGRRPFIGALDNNNGVARFVSDKNSSLDKNVLGVNYNGNGMVIGFYHPYECIFSDDVKRFHLKHYEDNQFVLLFMKVCILMQKQKFGYLYKFNAERMAHTSIMLPITEDGTPDYAFMELYGKLVFLRKYKQYLSALKGRVG